MPVLPLSAVTVVHVAPAGVRPGPVVAMRWIVHSPSGTPSPSALQLVMAGHALVASQVSDLGAANITSSRTPAGSRVEHKLLDVTFLLSDSVLSSVLRSFSNSTASSMVSTSTSSLPIALLVQTEWTVASTAPAIVSTPAGQAVTVTLHPPQGVTTPPPATTNASLVQASGLAPLALGGWRFVAPQSWSSVVTLPSLGLGSVTLVVNLPGQAALTARLDVVPPCVSIRQACEDTSLSLSPPPGQLPVEYGLLRPSGGCNTALCTSASQASTTQRAVVVTPSTVQAAGGGLVVVRVAGLSWRTPDDILLTFPGYAPTPATSVQATGAGDASVSFEPAPLQLVGAVTGITISSELLSGAPLTFDTLVVPQFSGPLTLKGLLPAVLRPGTDALTLTLGNVPEVNATGAGRRLLFASVQQSTAGGQPLTLISRTLLGEARATVATSSLLLPSGVGGGVVSLDVWHEAVPDSRLRVSVPYEVPAASIASVIPSTVQQAGGATVTVVCLHFELFTQSQPVVTFGPVTVSSMSISPLSLIHI